MGKFERIRVLLTVPHLGSAASPYREMIAYSRHIDRDRFDFTVCSLRPSGIEETTPVLNRLRTPFFVAPFRPTGRTPAKMRESLAAQRALASKGPFHIQHSLDFTSSPWEAGMARWAGRKYVYSQRNRNEDGSDLGLRAKVALSSRIVIIGQHLGPFLEGYGGNPKKFCLIPNGLDFEEFDEAASAPPPLQGDYILSAGHLVKRKRHFDLIRAFGLLRDSYPKLRLAIAGWGLDPEHERELRSLVTELKLEGRVEFLGTRTDVPQLMCHAKLVALVSESEGIPWTLLEGMAARVPVIATDIPPNAEVVRHGENGLLARLGDHESIANAIRQTLEDREGVRDRIRQARTFVEDHYSARTMVRRTEDLYTEMMGQPVSAPEHAASHSR